jgi:uncharacterized protein YjbI with pentapeptide repeats
MAGPDTNTNALPTPIWGFGPPSPEPDTKKLDALLASLNGSAERFQTLWFSFLGLTLYLAIAALATTHRDLLLNNPQTLPILNIKVELLPFYVIAPLLYLVFHFYLLMMLALLARTAAEFDKQLRSTLPVEPERERYRAQVGNALFLQLLVGMKGERAGVNALLMGLIALITIVLAPLTTLVLTQMMFLPYHHLRITWWHRAVVVADLVLIIVMTYRCFFPRGVRKAPLVLGALSRKPRWATAMGFCLLLTVVLGPLAYWLSFSQGRWAGEPKASSFEEWTQWMAGKQPELPEVNPDYSTTADGVAFGLFPNRLKLPSETIVGEKKLEETKKEMASRGGDFVPTIDLDFRDLQAANLYGADLRGVSLSRTTLRGANLESVRLDNARLYEMQLQGADLRSAQMQGADLRSAQLQGANLSSARLQGTDLSGAQLQGADLTEAQLQGADLRHAQLQHANLSGAQLQRANLEGAQLQGASLFNVNSRAANLGAARLWGAVLTRAQLQGAYFGSARLEGAIFDDAQLQGASLLDAHLQGADLDHAQLQGADLFGAHLQGANLNYAQLQGTELSSADLTDSSFDRAFVFRTRVGDANLSSSLIRAVRADQVKLNETRGMGVIEPLIAPDVEAWIAAATEFARETDKADVTAQFARLRPNFQDDAQEPTWLGMQEASIALDPDGAHHRERLAALLGDLACNRDGAPYIARGLVGLLDLELPSQLAELGDQLERVRKRMKDGREKPESCPGVAGFTEEDWRALEALRPN